MDHLHPSVTGAFVDVGLPIGENDDLLTVKIPVEGMLEPLRRPRARFAVAFRLCQDSIDELADITDERLKLGPSCIAPEQPPQFIAPTPPGQPCGGKRDDRRAQTE